MKNAVETAGKMIDKCRTCYLGYLDAEGFPAVRAMLRPRERVGIREIFFSTNTSSNKVARFRENPNACVYFVDTRFFCGVCLSGTVEVLETAEAKERVWRKGDTLYYKGGVTDEDYCVLKFTAKKGRYYSAFRSEDFAIAEQESA